ncbi:Rab9 effector protein [Microdochium nivale]|nr:Rab9 effector protein [Microdochium nivale]
MTFESSRTHPDAGTFQPNPARPQFNSFKTSDRIRESSTVTSPSSKIRKGRRSVFREEGLSIDTDNQGRSQKDSTEDESRTDLVRNEEQEFGDNTGLSSSTPITPTTKNSSDHIEDLDDSPSKARTGWLSRLTMPKRPRIRSAASAPPGTSMTGYTRVATVALLIALVLPAARYNTGRQRVELSGVDAMVLNNPGKPVLDNRQNNPTDICARWSGQAAMVNGTMYYYGGRTKTEVSQTGNQWNNDLLALDLTRSWDVNSPAMKALPQPSGPPAVSLGYLWNDYKRLFLYGGQYSDNPPATPEPMSLWQFDIASRSWKQFQNPKTSAGNYSEPDGSSIQSASEGAGISVPELGVSWYFGGHLDMYTTPGWTANRTYLKSLLEFTHPGYANNGVDSLHAAGAPDGGAYRNITLGGIQNEAGFTERADGTLVYVPGWGLMGILLGLGGGVVTNHESEDAFASMSTIDVYDIKTSEWYLQETHGEAPRVRVNPCSVVFSAPDASSFNIYMYGGQNLLPYGEQIQYQDMWILTIPSFTWIKVDLPGGGQPAGRAGHMCAARDGQLVVWGGFTGSDKPCESPGIYNFDASKLEWTSSFTAADHASDHHPDNGVLAGSFGYQVPGPVQSVIGGSSNGGATVTIPAVGTPTAGPFATGQAPVFTITAAGQTATVTNTAPGATGGGSASGNADGAGSSDGTNPGLVAAGVIAGLLGLAALYLGFCAWLYRRQVGAYKRHMAVANSYGNDEDYLLGPEHAVVGGVGGLVREKLRRHQHRRGSSSAEDGEQFAWVGQQNQVLGEPKWVLDSSGADASPSANSGISGGSSGAVTAPGSAGNGSQPGGGAGSASLAAGASGMPRPSVERYPWAMGGGGGLGYEASPVAAGGQGMGIGMGPWKGSGVRRNRSTATRSTASGLSEDGFMDGREPSFFSVVLGPRRALRVVNGIEE